MYVICMLGLNRCCQYLIFALFLAQHSKSQKLCELFSHPGYPQGSIESYISGPKGSNQIMMEKTEKILMLLISRLSLQRDLSMF